MIKRKKWDPDFHGLATRVVTRLCQIGEATAKPLAPANTGDLRDSIGYEVDAGLTGVTGRVYAGAEHAEPVEMGTEPHFPPLDALREWARLVLEDEDAAYPIARKIAKVGTEPQPFMTPAFEEMVRSAADVVRQERRR